MLQNKTKDQKGFTIIEVLIVLAIAGLILLIVFLAVPALQRNSRNTQRKNDIAAVIGGINDYITNNGGTLPTTLSFSGNDLTIKGSASGTNEAHAKLGYYDSAGVPGTLVASATYSFGKTTSPVDKLLGVGQAFAATAVTNSVTTDSFQVVKSATCNATGTDVTTGASSRSFAVAYEVETGGVAAHACQQ